MTSYDSDISVTISASRERNEMIGGVCGGYDEARVSRMRRICLHGAAHEAWNDMTARVVNGREDKWERNVASSLISVIVVIVNLVKLEMRVEKLDARA